METLAGSTTLAILLSTYNGAKYVAEQIESIRAQSLTDWVLIVRDDGSVDSTVRLVEGFAKEDRRIRLLEDGRGNLGPVASFGALLEHAAGLGAAYIALSDQDDVWKADKLELQLAMLRAHETDAGCDSPTLVHSDLAVVSDALQLIHDSYLRRQRIEHLAVDSLRRLLVQNFVTGCTTLFNRALLLTAIPVPPVVMHDWWLAQCAAATGDILFVEAPTVLYRQHGGNVLGSRGALRMYVDAVRRPADQWARDAHHLAASRDQACALASRLRGRAKRTATDIEHLELVAGFCDALRDGRSTLSQLRAVRRLGVTPRSLTYPLFFYLRILCGLPAGSAVSRQL